MIRKTRDLLVSFRLYQKFMKGLFKDKLMTSWSRNSSFTCAVSENILILDILFQI